MDALLRVFSPSALAARARSLKFDMSAPARFNSFKLNYLVNITHTFSLFAPNYLFRKLFYILCQVLC